MLEIESLWSNRYFCSEFEPCEKPHTYGPALDKVKLSLIFYPMELHWINENNFQSAPDDWIEHETVSCAICKEKMYIYY